MAKTASEMSRALLDDNDSDDEVQEVVPAKQAAQPQAHIWAAPQQRGAAQPPPSQPQLAPMHARYAQQSQQPPSSSPPLVARSPFQPTPTPQQPHTANPSQPLQQQQQQQQQQLQQQLQQQQAAGYAPQTSQGAPGNIGTGEAVYRGGGRGGSPQQQSPPSRSGNSATPHDPKRTQQNALLVKELVRLLFERCKSDPPRHHALKEMMKELQRLRERGDVTFNIPKELLNRARTIVGEDMLKEALATVKERFSRSKKEQQQRQQQQGGGGGGGGGVGVSHGIVLNRPHAMPQHGGGRGGGPVHAHGAAAAAAAGPSLEELEQRAEASVGSREQVAAALDESIKAGGQQRGAALRQATHDASALALVNEDEERRQLGAHMAPPGVGGLSAGAGSPGGVGGVGGGGEYEDPMDPDGVCALNVLDRRETERLFTRKVAMLGCGKVAVGSSGSSSSSSSSVGSGMADPCMMLSEAVNAYLRQVVGDCHRLARQRMQITAHQFGDQIEWGRSPAAAVGCERAAAEAALAAAEAAEDGAFRRAVGALEAEHERRVRAHKRDPRKVPEPKHWLEEELEAVARGDMDCEAVARHVKKRRLCKEHGMGPYVGTAAAGSKPAPLLPPPEATAAAAAAEAAAAGATGAGAAVQGPFAAAAAAAATAVGGGKGGAEAGGGVPSGTLKRSRPGEEEAEGAGSAGGDWKRARSEAGARAEASPQEASSGHNGGRGSPMEVSGAEGGGAHVSTVDGDDKGGAQGGSPPLPGLPGLPPPEAPPLPSSFNVVGRDVAAYLAQHARSQGPGACPRLQLRALAGAPARPPQVRPSEGQHERSAAGGAANAVARRT